MKGKKKLIISLSIAIAVLFIAIVAIVSISAALNQNITSKVKVNFKPSQQVIGYVSATYKFGDTTRNMTTNGMGNGNKTVQFNYNDKQTIKTLLMQNEDLKDGKLEIPTETNYIILAFQFVNTGYSDFTARLDLSSVTTQNNIELLYSNNGTMWFTQDLEIDVPAPTGLYPPSPVNCYIKIKVDNIALDADFEGSLIWDLVAEEDK